MNHITNYIFGYNEVHQRYQAQGFPLHVEFAICHGLSSSLSFCRVFSVFGFRVFFSLPCLSCLGSCQIARHIVSNRGVSDLQESASKMKRILAYAHVLTSESMVAALKQITDAWELRPGLPDMALTLFYVSASDLCLASTSPSKKTLKEIQELWKQFEKSGGQKTQVMQAAKTELSQLEKQARQQAKAATAAEGKQKSDKSKKGAK